MLAQNSTCDNLRASIYASDYAYGRQTYREAMWSMVQQMVVGTGLGAYLSKQAPQQIAVQAAYNSIAISAVYAQRRTELAVLNGLWGIANCGHQPVIERALPWPNSGGGWSDDDPGNWTWHCVRYNYEISYDGGITYYVQSSVVVCARVREE